MPGSEDSPRNERSNRSGGSRYANFNAELPVENRIYQGKIVKIENFGAFVEIEGIQHHGLVHISHISKDRVDVVSEVVSEGQQVFVKVLSVEESDEHSRRPRIALSMKFANQSDGTDRDPNGIEAERSSRMRRSFGNELPAPLALDAIYKTVCSKCGGKGHLALEW